MAYSKQNFQDGQILNAANLEAMENGIIAGQGAHNLLDNSDFRDPVISKGIGAIYNDGKKYICDKWYDTYKFGGYSFEKGVGITLSYGTNHCYCVQKINNASQYYGKTMTLALQLSNGTIYVTSGTYLSSSISLKISGDNWEYDLFYDRVELVVISGSITVSWIALYEGSYDASTLPSYVPKGKHVEMLNCNVPLAPHNLLDNSDFRNPVNQRGFSSTTSTGESMGIDRWLFSVNSDGSLSLTADGLVCQNANLIQKIESKLLDSSKEYTQVFWLSDGTPVFPTKWIDFNYSSGVGRVVYYGITGTIVAAALYEGSYTADTLPAYQPKGYAAELAECQRYYIHCGEGSWMTGLFKVGEGLIVEIPAANNIRATYPTIIVKSPKMFTTNGWYDITYSSCAVTKCWTKLLFNIPEEANPYIANGNAYIITGIVGVSADL